MIKHSTASTFVFGRFPEGGEWRLGLIEHPRLGRRMVPGGHVEPEETQEEAALREVAEEAGLRARLVPAPAAAFPAGFPHPAVAMPWWITEQLVPADNHLGEPHVHVDHQYVAVAEGIEPVSVPVHPFGWYRRGDLEGLAMFEDTRLLAAVLFERVDHLAGLGQLAAVR